MIRRQTLPTLDLFAIKRVYLPDKSKKSMPSTSSSKSAQRSLLRITSRVSRISSRTAQARESHLSTTVGSVLLMIDLTIGCSGMFWRKNLPCELVPTWFRRTGINGWREGWSQRTMMKFSGLTVSKLGLMAAHKEDQPTCETPI